MQPRFRRQDRALGKQHRLGDILGGRWNRRGLGPGSRTRRRSRDRRHHYLEEPATHLGGYQSKAASLFVAKLSADGKSILAGTYFGGDGADFLAALRLDRAGNVYIAGNADSAVFPTTPGAYQTQRGTAAPPPRYAQYCDGPCTDQFVAKFDPSLTRLQFSTLFGTSISEGTGDLALGLDGTLYVSGVRGPSNSQGPGATHPILTRFSADASSVIYSIELASNYDGGPVVTDADGNAYVASWSNRWAMGAGSLTVKVSPQGGVLWQQQIPEPSNLTSMTLNSQSELVTSGLASYALRPTQGAPGLCTSIMIPPGKRHPM